LLGTLLASRSFAARTTLFLLLRSLSRRLPLATRLAFAAGLAFGAGFTLTTRLAFGTRLALTTGLTFLARSARSPLAAGT
jgi:hypothetical protein